MKKIITSVLTLTLLSVNILPGTAQAAESYVLETLSGSKRYEEDLELSNLYTAFDVEIFFTNDNLGMYDYKYLVRDSSGCFCPISFDYSKYSIVDATESDAITVFLAENYPDITVTITPLSSDNHFTAKLDYDDQVTQIAQKEIAIAIYENLGILFDFAVAEDIIPLSRLGDLDSDGAVNALDASNILTYYSDSQTGNTDTYTDEDIADITLLGDYDADGAVNALDASLVLKEYAETQTNC